MQLVRLSSPPGPSDLVGVLNEAGGERLVASLVSPFAPTPPRDQNLQPMIHPCHTCRKWPNYSLPYQFDLLADQEVFYFKHPWGPRHLSTDALCVRWSLSSHEGRSERPPPACLPQLSLSAEASPLLLEATSCGSAAAMTVRAFQSPGESFLHILSIWCLRNSASRCEREAWDGGLRARGLFLLGWARRGQDAGQGGRTNIGGQDCLDLHTFLETIRIPRARHSKPSVYPINWAS